MVLVTTADFLPSFRLAHLTFTGPDLEPIGIEFCDGLTIVYGGSNAGKSYSLKVIDFLLGGNPPGVLIQGEKYEEALLGLKFSDGTAKTLVRSRRGGAITLYDGLAPDGNLAGRTGTPIGADHGKSKKGSVSELLLESIGIVNAKVAETENAKLVPFSLRHFMPYLAINEDRMFTSDSPTLISPKNPPTLNKNVFRFILTGQDDSKVATVPNEAAIKASNSGKVELLEELIAELDRGLEGVDLQGIEQQRDRLAQRLESSEAELGAIQSDLDTARAERRDLLDSLEADRAQRGQLEAMQARFLELKETYLTDIRRLEAIEEGGFLLQRFEDQPCPMCGALPGDQHLPHELGDLDRQQATAQAEIAKIRRDLVGLEAALSSIVADIAGTDFRIDYTEVAIRGKEGSINRLRPQEAASRTAYQTMSSEVARLDRHLEMRDQRSALSVRKDAIAAMKVGRQKAEGLIIGIDGPTGHKFAQAVKDVLVAWNYPGIEAVTWDSQLQDIAINGRPRGENGKGVKAVFHSAFVVALMIYCRQNRLPHPGFVVLDSPLVTYRKPIHYKRHGALEADERQLAETSLDDAFYRHLASLGDIGQVYVIENNDPPAAAVAGAKVHVFSGETGSGRQGLFPT